MRLVCGNILICGVVLAVTGCTTIEGRDRLEVEFQHEAAEFNMSIVSVGEWDKYIKALTPNFKLTADEALKKAIPTTASLSELNVSKTAVSLKYGASGTTTTSEAKSTKTDGVVSNVDTRTVTENAGELPENNQALPDGTAAYAPPLSTESSVSNPLLTYTAATALYQEVQLLNSYIEDASLRHGYTPYVVRMNVGVRPYARNLPYDVFATMSFFPKWEACINEWCDSSSLEGAPLKSYSQPAVVVPLLVTDGLESSEATRVNEIARQLDLAFGMISGGGILGLGGSHSKSNTVGISANDLNSTFTVGRIADGVLEFRMGAVNSSKSHVMITRNHSVTLLVMVPTKEIGYRKIDDLGVVQGRTTVDVRALTSLKHSDGGKSPKRRSRSHEFDALSEVLSTSCESLSDRKDKDRRVILAQKLQKHLLRNDYRSFRNMMKSNDCKEGRELWLFFAEELSMREFIGASFELPVVREMSLPAKDQTYLVQDDGSSWTLMLNGGKGLRAKQLSAMLSLDLGAGRQLNVDSSGSPTVSANGDSVSFSFPSPKKLGIPAKDWTSAAKPPSFSFTVQNRSPEYGPRASCRPVAVGASQCIQTYEKTALVPIKNASLSPIGISIEGKSIAASSSKGTLGLTATSLKNSGGALAVDKIEITIIGPLISKVSAFKADGTVLPPPAIYKGVIAALPNSRLVIELKNLEVGKEVSVSAIGKKGKQNNGKVDAIKVSVVEATSKKKEG